MPVVPTYNQQQVSSSALPSNGLSVQSSPEAFGAGLAQTGNQYIAAFAEAKQRANVALSQDASLQLRKKANELMTDPQNGLLSQQGKNAIGKATEYESHFDAAAGEIASTLPDEAARGQFMQQAQEMRLQFSSSANKHEMGQIQSYEADQFQSTLTLNAETAATQYGDNQAYVSTNKQVFRQIEEFGFSHGWSDEQIQAKKQEFKTGTARQAIENQIGADYMQFMQQNGEPSSLGGVSRTSEYYGGDAGSVKGMTQQGNINLMNRPTVQNEDGSVSTVRTISVGTDDGEVLIPTVSDDGKLLTDDEAIALYEKTGKHLGIFDNPDDATIYAEQLHNQQEQMYVKGSGNARGVRNNNPGNIRKSKDVWVGQTGNDGSFVTFATPAHGIRATGKNLLSYGRQGYVTPEQIITRWAPPEDKNDTEGYIQFVSEYLGVPRDTRLDLTDLNTLTRLSMAIMIKENGQGEFNKISGDDISNGIQSALGLSALPQSAQGGQSAPAPKRLTGSAAFDALDQSDQAKYLRQAEQMDKQRQQQLQAELGTRVADSYAAWENGLDAPGAPGAGEIMAAFGYDKGTSMLADMQEAKHYAGLISAAKEMTPAARDIVLESNKPSSDKIGYASSLQYWGKMKRKFNELDTEWEANQGRQTVSNAINKGVPLDPNNKSNKAAVDSYYTANFNNINLKDEDQVAGVIKLIGNTGIIPTQLLSNLNAASVSQDSAAVLPTAELFSRLYETNPTAITGLSKEKQAFYLNIKQYKDAGVDDEKSVALAYNLAYNQTDALKMQLAAEQSTQPYKKERLNAADDFVSKQSSIFRIDPSATDTTPEAKRYLSDYESLFDINFRVAGGNADVAKKMTHQQIERRWSITEVNGKAQLMKYAPEALYPGGPSGWQAKQWEDEKWKLKYGEEKGGIQSIKGKTSEITGRVTGISADTPKPKVAGDIILIADKDTPRNGDYAVFVREDKDGIPNDQPYYDGSGRKIRYKPELESYQPYQDLVAQLNEEKIYSMQKGSARREFYDRHDDLDKQYKQSHEQRIEKQKGQIGNYFSWGGDK